MSIVRSEAAELVKRWAETVLSGAVLGIMLWVGGSMVWAGGIMGVVVLAVAVGAGFWFRTAFARARLGAAPLGPGIVMIDERRITYMGPETGGVVAIDSIEGIEIASISGGVHEAGASWVLRHAEGPPLVVPAGAEGADLLPEAFAALPGFSYDRVVAAMGGASGDRAIVWRRRPGSSVSALASGAASD